MYHITIVVSSVSSIFWCTSPTLKKHPITIFSPAPSRRLHPRSRWNPTPNHDCTCQDFAILSPFHFGSREFLRKKWPKKMEKSSEHLGFPKKNRGKVSQIRTGPFDKVLLKLKPMALAQTKKFPCGSLEIIPPCLNALHNKMAGHGITIKVEKTRTNLRFVVASCHSYY